MNTAMIVPAEPEQAVPIAAVARELQVELIQQYEAFLQLGPVWNRLVEESGIDHPFMRHEWMRTWWDCFEHGAKLYILLVKEGDEPIAIAPLMLDRGRVYGCPLRRLRGIANVYTERFDFILARRPQEACRAIWKYLASKASQWDVLELRQLPDNARIKECLPPLAFKDGFLLGSWHCSDGPYIPINQSWEAYLKGLSKKHLSNLKGRVKGLRRVGDVQHEVVTGGDDLDRTLSEAFLLEAAAWKGQAGTAIMNRPDREGFYRQLMKRAAEQGFMQIHFLTLSGKRIAVQLALVLHNKLYVLKSGYDPHYAAFAPSLALCEMMLHHAWSQHLNEVDFLGDAERWKLNWASQTRAHSWFFVFANRPRTRLVHRLKFGLVPRLSRNPLYLAVKAAGNRIGLRVHGD